jgi:hypothetical protein
MNTAFRLNSDNFSFLFYTCLELEGGERGPAKVKINSTYCLNIKQISLPVLEQVIKKNPKKTNTLNISDKSHSEQLMMQ